LAQRRSSSSSFVRRHHLLNFQSHHHIECTPVGSAAGRKISILECTYPAAIHSAAGDSVQYK